MVPSLSGVCLELRRDQGEVDRMSTAPMERGSVAGYVVLTRDEILDVADVLLVSAGALHPSAPPECLAWIEQVIGVLEDRVANPPRRDN
jgi:hypothetical protein